MTASANAAGPRPLNFVEDGRTDFPTKATEALWLGWSAAETRANSLQLDNDQLRDEIRELDKKREVLKERVRSLEQRGRLKGALASFLISASGILSGVAMSMAKSDQSPDVTFYVIIALTEMSKT